MNKTLLLILTMLFINLPAFALDQDFIVEEFLQGKNIEKPFVSYNYKIQNSVKVPITLNIVNPIKSENDLYEGQIIKFKVSEDVHYNGKLIVKSGTIVNARIETIIANGMNGIPASIIFGSFVVPNITVQHLDFYSEKYGRDLSLLVYPIKWILTPLPPTGSLTNFIKGGHVKINKNTKITVYYYP